jgi:hypothetical protein
LLSPYGRAIHIHEFSLNAVLGLLEKIDLLGEL